MIGVVRAGVGIAGVGIGAFGVISLWGEGTDNLVATGLWLIGGVLLHDGVLAPIAVLAGVLVARFVRRPFAAPVIVAGIVVSSVTLAVVPVLGRFGARSDNPTLLPRDYTAGWLALGGLTLAAVAVAGWAQRRSTGAGEHGTSAGRR